MEIQLRSYLWEWQSSREGWNFNIRAFSTPRSRLWLRRWTNLNLQENIGTDVLRASTLHVPFQAFANSILFPVEARTLLSSRHCSAEASALRSHTPPSDLPPLLTDPGGCMGTCGRGQLLCWSRAGRADSTQILSAVSRGTENKSCGIRASWSKRCWALWWELRWHNPEMTDPVW